MYNMTSKQKQLIVADLKSWAVTTALMFGPMILTSFLELLAKQDWGEWATIASIVLGSLLKLVQKWQQVNKY